MGHELALRLADAQAVVESLGRLHPELVDDHTIGPFLSVLDHALRGDPGCIEPEEWEKTRERSLHSCGEYLGLPVATYDPDENLIMIPSDALVQAGVHWDLLVEYVMRLDNIRISEGRTQVRVKEGQSVTFQTPSSVEVRG